MLDNSLVILSDFLRVPSSPSIRFVCISARAATSCCATTEVCCYACLIRPDLEDRGQSNSTEQKVRCVILHFQGSEAQGGLVSIAEDCREVREVPSPSRLPFTLPETQRSQRKLERLVNWCVVTERDSMLLDAEAVVTACGCTPAP